MKPPIATPLNETQARFNELCRLGGGMSGGPARGHVLALLKDTGQRLNKAAHREIAEHLGAFHESNPWFVCFAVGLCWGHLARVDLDFTGAVVRLMEKWNSADLSIAKSFHLERGAQPIEQSLVGAHQLFGKVILPDKLPDTLQQLATAQNRWLSPILSPDRPRYIGSWNATAMFMTALFSKPSLAATHREPPPLLPPGGPIYRGLQLLYRAHVVSRPPVKRALDDEAFESGALYENNSLLAEICRTPSDWSMSDAHSGIYMLGTSDVRSAGWI